MEMTTLINSDNLTVTAIKKHLENQISETMKVLKNIKYLTALCLMLLCAVSTNAFADGTEAFTLTKLSWTEGKSLTDLSIARKSGITVSFSKGTASEGPKAATSSKSGSSDIIALLSPNNVLTITSSSDVITQVEFIFTLGSTAAKGENYSFEPAGTYTTTSGYVWTGATKSLVLTNTGTGNFEISKIEVTYASLTTLSESTANTITAAENVNVQLIRTLSPDYWNTFCVPFNISDISDYGTVYEFSSFSNHCYKFTKATSIEAGKPYLVKPTKEIKDPFFTGVSITATTPSTLTFGDYSMIGTYSPYTMATDGTEQFLGENDYLYIPASDKNTISGLRAYFKFPESTASAKIKVEFAGSTTDISKLIIDGHPATDGFVYNLCGQQVGTSLNGLQPGIYIVNGKKIIVK